MLWWIVGIIAAWVVIGTVVAVWIGQAVSHAELEDAAAELRRVEKHDTGLAAGVNLDTYVARYAPINRGHSDGVTVVTRRLG